MHVVVLDERDPALEARLPGMGVHALQHLLAGLVARMGLTREHDLHRAPGVHQQPLQAVGVTEDQVRPLVGREATPEADREGVRIEQDPRPHKVQGFLPLIRPAPPRLLSDAAHEMGLELVVHRPQGGAVQLQDLVPEPRVVHPGEPIGSEMRVEQGEDPVRHPGGDMGAIGHVADRHARHLALGPERRPDTAGLFTVTARHRVDPRRQPDGRDGHVKAVVVHHRVMAEAKEGFAGDTHLLPHRTDALLHLLEREGVVPGGYRRVGREHARGAHPADRVRERRAPRHQLAYPLDQHERGVPFVGVPGRGVVPKSAKYSDAAHAQHPFLPQPQVRPAGVEPMGQPAVGRIVLLEVRVQEQNRHPPHHHAPGAHAHGAPGQPHGREAGIALRPAHPLERCRGHVETLLGVLLPAVQSQPLVGVSSGIEQTHTHERHAEVGGRLALVPGQDAETAGVDGNGGVQAKLGAEVGDGPRDGLGVRRGEPGAGGRGVPCRGGDDGVVQAQERGVGRAGGESRGIDPAQQLDGIVLGAAPQRRIKQAEQGARVAVPAPRQIGGDGRQSIDPFGNGWAARFGLGHRACKLSTGGSAWEAVGDT